MSIRGNLATVAPSSENKTTPIDYEKASLNAAAIDDKINKSMSRARKLYTTEPKDKNIPDAKITGNDTNVYILLRMPTYVTQTSKKSPRIVTPGEGISPVYLMWINPETFNTQYKNRINIQQTRGGWLEEHWGTELDTLQISGSTGGFVHPKYGYAANLKGWDTSTVSFGTTGSREDTAAYANFIDLLEIYRNNAAGYNTTGNPVFRGDVTIQYDGAVYDGFFQSLDWNESANMPYRFTFNFQFKITHTQIYTYK